MDKKVGLRIKDLREQAGLTQKELADRLGFTPQTVSNWEAGTREPDIDALVKITSLLHVSLDYLLAGKEDDNISLDDMDAQKRLLLIVKKDDLDNFIKYGYLKSNSVFNGYHTYQNGIRMRKPNKEFWIDLINKKANKIFNSCCDELIKDNSSKVWAAFLVYDFIDEFVKMVVDNDRADVLETIGFRIFAIGDSSKKELPFVTTWGVSHYVNTTDTYFIKRETFEYIFENRGKAPKCYNYATTLELKIVPLSGYGDNLHYTYTHFEDRIVELAVKYKDFELLDNILKVYKTEKENLDNLFGSRDYYHSYNVANSYVYDDSAVYGRMFWFKTDIITQLFDMDQIDRANALNDYNISLIESAKNKHPAYANAANKVHYLRKDQIEKIMIMKDDSVSEEEKHKLNYLNNRLLRTNSLGGIRDPKYLKELLDNYPVHYYEFIYKAVLKKDYSEVYKFLVDSGLEEIALRLLANNEESTKDALVRAWDYFGAIVDRTKLGKNDIRSLQMELPFEKLFDVNHLRNEDRVRIIDSIKDKFTDKDSRDLGFAISRNSNKVFRDEAVKIPDNAIIRIIQAKKDSIYRGLLDSLAKEKHEQELLAERIKAVKGLKREYFEDLLTKEDNRIFILDLCSLLDALLKYDRLIEGEDFFDRLSKYFEIIKSGLPTSRDCDDGWGYMVLDTAYENEVVIPAKNKADHIINLLSRLRIQRNNIAHAERNPVNELNKEELRECLDIVFSIATMEVK